MYSIGGLGVITSIIYTHSFSAKLEVWSTHHHNWVVTGWWLGVLALVATFWNYWKYNYDWIIWNAAWQWLAESGKKLPVLPGQPVISCFADDQPRLFLQQEGVEKLGSGSTQSCCRLGWFWLLELGAIFKHDKHGNQQALRARPWKVHCLSACILYPLICPTPGLLPITPTTSSYLHWSYLHWSSKKVWLWSLQSSSLHHKAALGSILFFIHK